MFALPNMVARVVTGRHVPTRKQRLPTIVKHTMNKPRCLKHEQTHDDPEPLFLGGYKLKTRTGHWLGRGNTLEEYELIHTPDITSLKKGTEVLVRIDSACWTGDHVGGDLCDCHWQFKEAIRMIASNPGPGLVIHCLSHEGKGNGLVEKLEAWNGHEYAVTNDRRTYAGAAVVLHHLGIQRVVLITNNPDKCSGIERYGIQVVDTRRIVSTIPAHRPLLVAKRARFGHIIPDGLLIDNNDLAEACA